jgi:hypothetical protein
MIRVRSLSTVLLLAATTFGAAAALVTPSASADEAKKPCTHDPKFGPVKAACAAGGLKQAKDLMKGYEKAIEAKGGSFDCKDCHTDQKTFPLKDNAKADFDKAKAKYPDIIK